MDIGEHANPQRARGGGPIGVFDLPPRHSKAEARFDGKGIGRTQYPAPAVAALNIKNFRREIILGR